MPSMIPRCLVQGNEVYGGAQAGLFLHRSSDQATVKGESSYLHFVGYAIPDIVRHRVVAEWDVYHSERSKQTCVCGNVG